jgi:hypothetical protein
MQLTIAEIEELIRQIDAIPDAKRRGLERVNLMWLIRESLENE